MEVEIWNCIVGPKPNVNPIVLYCNVKIQNGPSSPTSLIDRLPIRANFNLPVVFLLTMQLLLGNKKVINYDLILYTPF